MLARPVRRHLHRAGGMLEEVPRSTFGQRLLDLRRRRLHRAVRARLEHEIEEELAHSGLAPEPVWGD